MPPILICVMHHHNLVFLRGTGREWLSVHPLQLHGYTTEMRRQNILR